ncbi:MAG: TIGR03663 family protein [Opitutales bacterium]|nr:TIGR03663 family protein [Opitutales bacterium]MBT6380652.1 TIGR03663 family protein [Opitutales bacterium]
MFRSPKINSYLFVAVGVAVIAAGMFLRVQNADRRILHSDEAVQAFQLWELMNTGHYEYDPVDKHGPLLYYTSLVLNKITGIDALELSQKNVRLVSIVASAGLLYLIAFGSRKRDPVALMAAALFALSPLPVIYGAYFVQEALFALLGFLALYTFSDYWKNPTCLRAGRFGLWAAALFATKETAVVHIFALFVATVVVQWKPFDLAEWKVRASLKPVSVAIGVFIAIWIFFFTAALSDFGQLTDSFKAFINYADRSQGQGHEKSIAYYSSLFWPRTIEGTRWGEAPFILLAFVGFGLLALNRDKRSRHYRLSVFYGVTCFVVYSLIPYKTPWLMLSSYVSFAYAAAFALSRFLVPRNTIWVRLTASCVVVLICWHQYQSTKLANYYAADARNPYLYQHTSPQFSKLVRRIADLEAVNPAAKLAIAVGGDDNAWPLPWYLRENPTVGYWPDPGQTPALDVVIGPTGALPSSLSETHIVEYHGLRVNIVLECWIRTELWDAFMKTRE